MRWYGRRKWLRLFFFCLFPCSGHQPLLHPWETQLATQLFVSPCPAPNNPPSCLNAGCAVLLLVSQTCSWTGVRRTVWPGREPSQCSPAGTCFPSCGVSWPLVLSFMSTAHLSCCHHLQRVYQCCLSGKPRQQRSPTYKKAMDSRGKSRSCRQDPALPLAPVTAGCRVSQGRGKPQGRPLSHSTRGVCP